jgi:hypothetical protein
VPLTVYDETIRVMRDAVERAKIGHDDRLSALRRLADESRRLESALRGRPFDEIVSRERRRSPSYGGMTVLGPARTQRAPARKSQLHLPGLG